MRLRTLVLAASLTVGLGGGAVNAMSQSEPTAPPEPMPECVAVVALGTGGADWYCGDVIRVPRGSAVLERGLVPCANEDGSKGPLPCRWDAHTRGNHKGVSFTILVRGTPKDGRRSVLYRYDTGITREGTVKR